MPDTKPQAEELTGFERCLAEWKRLHKECLRTNAPRGLDIEFMRFGYEMGRKDGRRHR